VRLEPDGAVGQAFRLDVERCRRGQDRFVVDLANRSEIARIGDANLERLSCRIN
jgi:hypothetical protein